MSVERIVRAPKSHGCLKVQVSEQAVFCLLFLVVGSYFWESIVPDLGVDLRGFWGNCGGRVFFWIF
jgi:hypothetical protein